MYGAALRESWYFGRIEEYLQGLAESGDFDEVAVLWVFERCCNLPRIIDQALAFVEKLAPLFKTSVKIPLDHNPMPQQWQKLLAVDGNKHKQAWAAWRIFGNLIATSADQITKFLMDRNTMGNGQFDNAANALAVAYHLHWVLGTFGELP